MIYICILDFNITFFDKNNYFEVIEITSLLCRWFNNKFEILDSFQEFCKPKYQPIITIKCRNLTGVTQSDIRNGLSFDEAFGNHYEWLYNNSNLDNFYIITEGTVILSNIALREYKYHNINVPEVYLKFVDIKEEFSNFYDAKECDIKTMSNSLKLNMSNFNEYKCCTNISNILNKMFIDGYDINEANVISIIL